MESIRVTLPKVVPECPLTQETVADAVQAVCGHFFEQASFKQYLGTGGRNCPTCRKPMSSYVVIPPDQWGETVDLIPIPIEGEHRVPQDTGGDYFAPSSVEGLILIARASGDTGFEAWCKEKEPAITAQMDSQAELTDKKIERRKRYPKLLAYLFSKYRYEDAPSIQSFINRFAGEGSNLQLVSHLCNQVFLDCAFEAAGDLMGGKGHKPPFDEGEAIKQAEKQRKFRALVGLMFALCLVAGTVRAIFSSIHCRK